MDRSKSLVVLGCCTALLIVGPPTVFGTDPEAPALREAVHFRTTSGLRADDEHVAASFFDGAMFPNRDWGVPLTESEAAELTRRADQQERFAPAVEYASAQSGYAGTYFDNQAGIHVFLFVGDLELRRAELASRAPAGADFLVKSAARTTAELESLRDAIEHARDELRAHGIHIVTTGLDDVSNTVAVGVDGDHLAVEAKLRAIYGNGVTAHSIGKIVLDACLSRDSCGNPMKGGLKITYTPTQWCTSGFIGKVRNSVPIQLRVITAGHCIELNGGVGADWDHPSVSLSTADMERWYTNSTADVGSIRLSEGGDRHLVMASATNDIRPITGFQSNNTQLIGYSVCRAGARSGYLCGHILRRDETLDVDGKAIQHQWTVDFDSSPGDSGGAYILANTAYGIHSDSTDDAAAPPRVGWYSPIGWTLAEASISYCFNATCY